MDFNRFRDRNIDMLDLIRLQLNDGNMSPEQRATYELIEEGLIQNVLDINAILEHLATLTEKLKALDDKNEDYKLTIEELKAKLDELSEGMTELDSRASSNFCKNMYGEVLWAKLDEFSKKFIVTSDYIIKKLRQTGLDYAPAVIEMCRAFENELKAKIFTRFICELSNDNSLQAKSDKNTSPILKAAIEYRKTRKPFISLKQMINELERIESHRPDYCQKELLDFIRRIGWSPKKLADDSFIQHCKKYVDLYRNDSAHTTPFSLMEAQNCQAHTEKRIDEFNSCKEG